MALSLAKGRENDEVVTLTVVDEYSSADLLDEEAILAAGTNLLYSPPPPKPHHCAASVGVFFLTWHAHNKVRLSTRPTRS